MHAIPMVIALLANDTPFDPSSGMSFVYRSMVVPANLDACVPIGKYCPKVGQVTSSAGTVEAAGAQFRTNFIKVGPLRIGAEAGVGGTTGGADGSYGSDPVHVGNFLYTNVAASIGFATTFDHVNFRIDALGGFYVLKGGTALRTDDGFAIDLTTTNGYVEGRGTIAYFVSPRVAISAYGGAGLSQVWHAGVGFTFFFDPLDKNR